VVRRRVRPKSRGNVVNGKVQDYRFVDEKRKNIPDAGLASFYRERRERKKYEYDPHLDPQLVWAGKAEHTSFEVDTVALHIHERISTKAILKAVEKKELYRQLGLFAEPDLPLDKRIEFYQHDMDWTNRLILGDSLLVVNSLLEREMMAGKIQMIYIDPPYGISYKSNFQPSINKKDVQDGQDDSLTREPEQIKAYRDTWTLGIHSYLTYLRDRLFLCRELLNESGSIFVQINEVNLPFVRLIMNDVFGSENYITQIPFVKTGAQTSERGLPTVVDYILWYAKDKKSVKVRQLFILKDLSTDTAKEYPFLELPDGSRKRLTPDDFERIQALPKDSKLFQLQPLHSQHFSKTRSVPFNYKGRAFLPPSNRQWGTSIEGLEKLSKSRRIEIVGNTLRFVRYYDDMPVSPLTNLWTDTSSFAERLFVVQTTTKAIERCILLTTDTGDVVFDPTCGSGTTALMAEQWGRRWITCDTSRIALTIARQRLLCAVFHYYKLAHPEKGVSGGFVYETAPHVTMKTIVQNEPPQTEILYDRPIIQREKIRVSGPFTVEAIPVPSAVDSSWSAAKPEAPEQDLSINIAADYVNTMIDLVRKDGVTFTGGKHMTLENVRPIQSAGFLQAEAQVKQNGDFSRVAVSFGPRYGPVTARQVIEAAGSASMMGFSILVLAGFAFDPEAQATIQKNPHPNLQIHMANIRPDIEMHDLLKSPKGSQLFTVFGEPDVKIRKTGDEFVVELLGVDIYDPTTGEVHPSRPEDVAAWFLDQNYDGYTFCITQAFFPKEATNRNPWDKLENALHGVIDKKGMEKLRGTTSLPFKAGDQKRIAVKVIDQRGNEVIVVKKLEEAIQG